MANYTIGIGELGSKISQILEEYGEKCDKGINNAVKVAASEGKDIVKSNADGYGWERYPDSIAYKKDGDKQYRVYAKRPVGSLAHLLENGHRIVVSGIVRGRTGHTAARPHMLPAIPEIKEILIDEIEKAVKG